MGIINNLPKPGGVNIRGTEATFTIASGQTIDIGDFVSIKKDTTSTYTISNSSGISGSTFYASASVSNRRSIIAYTTVDGFAALVILYENSSGNLAYGTPLVLTNYVFYGQQTLAVSPNGNLVAFSVCDAAGTYITKYLRVFTIGTDNTITSTATPTTANNAWTLNNVAFMGDGYVGFTKYSDSYEREYICRLSDGVTAQVDSSVKGYYALRGVAIDSTTFIRTIVARNDATNGSLGFARWDVDWTAGTITKTSISAFSTYRGDYFYPYNYFWKSGSNMYGFAEVWYNATDYLDRLALIQSTTTTATKIEELTLTSDQAHNYHFVADVDNNIIYSSATAKLILALSKSSTSSIKVTSVFYHGFSEKVIGIVGNSCVFMDSTSTALSACKKITAKDGYFGPDGKTATISKATSDLDIGGIALEAGSGGSVIKVATL